MTSRLSTKPAAKSDLIVSVAGVRGIVGETLSPETIVRYVGAFASITKGPDILVGGDSRASRGWISQLVGGTLIAHGKRPFYGDLLPTPTIGMTVRVAGMDGGIAITASHNPGEYNGLKFFTNAGIFLGPGEFEKLKAALGTTPPRLEEYAGMWSVEPEKTLELHLNQLLDELEPIEGRTKVVIDCCNGAGSFLAPLVSKSYGGMTKTIHDNPTLPFPRGAEPLPENLGDLCAEVPKSKAALGFALDPDADRLALVDETGRAIGEERTLVLCADAWLRLKGKTPLVANLSSSRALEDVAAMHKTKVYRSKVGEAHVVALMKQKKAAIGGEGNGGVIIPSVHSGRDAAAGIALILLGMKHGGWKKLSDWNASIPDYAMVKDKVSIAGIEVAAVFAALRKAFGEASFDDTDGLKVIWEDRWLHVRPSGTEPIMRLFAEAPTANDAQAIIRKARKALP